MALEAAAGAVKSRLEGARPNAKRLRRLLDVHLVKIKEHDCFPVFLGQRLDSAPHRLVARSALFQAPIAPVGKLHVGIERHEGRPSPPLMRAKNVHRHRHHPGGEGRLFSKARQRAENLEKSILRHVRRLRTVAAEAIGEIEQRSLPALDDTGKSRAISGDHSSYRSKVFIVFHRDGGSWTPEPVRLVAFFRAASRKMQPASWTARLIRRTP